MNIRLRQPALGEGESEAIAIVSNRRCSVATDDRLARERCKEAYPDVRVIATAQVLKQARG